MDNILLTDAAPPYPLGELGQNQPFPWGTFHIDSADEFEDGSLLVLLPHYCSIFKIGRDSEVQWISNGHSGGDFILKNTVSFYYQHDARIHAVIKSTTLMSISNNDNGVVVSYVNQTTGIFLSVNTETEEATLVRKPSTLRNPSTP